MSGLAAAAAATSVAASSNGGSYPDPRLVMAPADAAPVPADLGNQVRSFIAVLRRTGMSDEQITQTILMHRQRQTAMGGDLHAHDAASVVEMAADVTNNGADMPASVGGAGGLPSAAGRYSGARGGPLPTAAGAAAAAASTQNFMLRDGAPMDTGNYSDAGSGAVLLPPPSAYAPAERGGPDFGFQSAARVSSAPSMPMPGTAVASLATSLPGSLTGARALVGGETTGAPAGAPSDMPAAAVNPLLAPLIEELRKIKKLHGDLQLKRSNIQKILTTYDSQLEEVRARFSKEYLMAEMNIIPRQLEVLVQQYRERVAQLVEMVRRLKVVTCAHSRAYIASFTVVNKRGCVPI